MSIREELEAREDLILSPRAAHASRSRGRRRQESECPLRPCFQRDRDRVIHSKAFRRLKHKSQVFLSPSGDHYRTRLTHTLEVSQIARTLARSLRLNEDLTEAIALAHDLGHTPFGHSGEAVLDELLPEGFRHYEQSLRVVDVLEDLNLTHEVRDGIVKHSKGMGAIMCDAAAGPATLEARLVRLADIIAYICHDIDDAMRADLLKPADLPADLPAPLGSSHSARIGGMVRDAVESTLRSADGCPTLSPEMNDTLVALRGFLFERVYNLPQVHRDFDRAKRLLSDLFRQVVDDPGHPAYAHAIYLPEGAGADLAARRRAATDFVAGMTDRYALELHRQIFLPRPWAVV